MDKINRMTANDYLKLGAGAIVATAIVFFGIKIYNKVKGKLDTAKETKDLRKEIDYKQVTLSDSEAQSIADTLKSSLNSNYWDDVDIIIKSLKRLQNPDDWKLVVIKFGKQKRDTWFSNVDGGLDEWLADALKIYEYTRVSELLSKIGVKI